MILMGLFSCKTELTDSNHEPQLPSPTFQTFEVASSVRALEVLASGEVWYAGSNGQYGYSSNGGIDWVRDSFLLEDRPMEFRSIASTREAIFLLATESPAMLFKSTDKGRQWQLVYREDHPACYYNAMTFWDDTDGIAVGDPIDGCLSILLTTDGGDHWEKLSCKILPPIEAGEAGFAASNTNVAVLGDHAWVGTGGAKARVFHTPDRGQNWEVYETPINQGGKMTGIFSVDFWDAQYGIIVGGDWEKKDRNTLTKAMTTDGGKSWTLLNDGQEPAFRSCVQYVPGSEGKELFAIGIPGISYSSNGGRSWELWSEQSFYTIRIFPSGKGAWLAGKNRLAKLVW